MENNKQYILNSLYAKGFKGSFTDLCHLSEAESEIKSLYSNGLLQRDFFLRYLSNFNFTQDVHDYRSLLIIAVPHPVTVLKLNYAGKEHDLVLPPTYVYEDPDHEVSLYVNKLISSLNHKVIPSEKLPLKLLAARSRLSQYGRNNITYIDSFGSYYRLLAFYTDIDASDEPFTEPAIMPECKNCSICRNLCPTHCIDSNQKIIHAERCLTYINENTGSFPDWIEDSFHNSLVGCMKCQEHCPANKGHKSIVIYEDVIPESDIEMIIKGSSLNELSYEAIEVIKKFSLLEYYDVLARNLTAVFKNL